ncbi:uncharacterized protein LOC144425881 [Styela clava]
MTAITVIKCLASLFSLVGIPEYVHSDRGTSFLANELREFLARKGIATSNTTPYHPKGNSQCERANQTIWKTIKLMLLSRNLPESAWEEVLPDALHATRSLLCTSTGTTPHNRMFNFERRSMIGNSVPDWLLNGGKVLLRKFVRAKSDPFCEEVELLEANTKYSLIRYPDGRESTVSTSDLARFPETVQSDYKQLEFEKTKSISESTHKDVPFSFENLDSKNGDTIPSDDLVEVADKTSTPIKKEEMPIRRSSRFKRAPDRYGDWAS